MSNFIYYEKLQDYEEQVRKAKEYDKLQQELQRKDNIINELKKTIKELIDDSEDTTCYEITNTVKRLLLEELESGE